MDKLRTSIASFKSNDEFEAMVRKMMLDLIDKDGTQLLSREASPLVHFAVSGFIVNPVCDKALMIHHNIYDSWGWTGGHADGESDLLAVALKEAKEETGILHVEPLVANIAALHILSVPPHIKKDVPIPTHLHLNVSYLLVASEDEALKVKPDENSGVKWIPFDEIGKYVTEPHMIEIYKFLVSKAQFAVKKSSY